MKLEQQVCSLELAKRLKELGVKQESLFHHVQFTDESGDEQQKIYTNGQINNEYAADWHEQVSAFTVAELGEMLPRNIEYDVSEYGTRDLIYSAGRTIINDGWYVQYSDAHPANKAPIYSVHADTEAAARAKMLVYLLENNLLK